MEKNKCFENRAYSVFIKNPFGRKFLLLSSFSHSIYYYYTCVECTQIPGKVSHY